MQKSLRDRLKAMLAASSRAKSLTAAPPAPTHATVCPCCPRAGSEDSGPCPFSAFSSRQVLDLTCRGQHFGDLHQAHFQRRKEARFTLILGQVGGVGSSALLFNIKNSETENTAGW